MAVEIGIFLQADINAFKIKLVTVYKRDFVKDRIDKIKEENDTIKHIKSKIIAAIEKKQKITTIHKTNVISLQPTIKITINPQINKTQLSTIILKISVRMFFKLKININ